MINKFIYFFPLFTDYGIADIKNDCKYLLNRIPVISLKQNCKKIYKQKLNFIQLITSNRKSKTEKKKTKICTLFESPVGLDISLNNILKSYIFSY